MARVNIDESRYKLGSRISSDDSDDSDDSDNEVIPTATASLGHPSLITDSTQDITHIDTLLTAIHKEDEPIASKWEGRYGVIVKNSESKDNRDKIHDNTSSSDYSGIGGDGGGSGDGKDFGVEYANDVGITGHNEDINYLYGNSVEGRGVSRQPSGNTTGYNRKIPEGLNTPAKPFKNDNTFDLREQSSLPSFNPYEIMPEIQTSSAQNATKASPQAKALNLQRLRTGDLHSSFAQQTSNNLSTSRSSKEPIRIVSPVPTGKNTQSTTKMRKLLTKERRIELLKERRAKRDAKSRRQIDRQVAAQARREGRAHDKNALQYSGWGVDHGYTGVAFSGARIGTVGKVGNKGIVKDDSVGRSKKKERRSLKELEEMEKEISAEMQKSYDMLRHIRDRNFKSPLNTDTQTQITPSRRILVVSFRLPFRLTRQKSSWVASAWKNEHFDSQLMDQSAYPCTWVGWPGADVDVGEQDHVRDHLVANRDYVPVFMPKRTTDLSYSGFCKQVLWPLMHSRALTTAFHIETNAEASQFEGVDKGSAQSNIYSQSGNSDASMKHPDRAFMGPSHNSGVSYSSTLVSPIASASEVVSGQSHQMVDMWAAYKNVAQAFAETVKEVYEEGDMIWIHGYHLMLVPDLIRQLIPGASISFSLHLPFPTSEIFRVLPWRKEILKGILSSDIIGFQTFHYSRHFVRACTRILGVYSSPAGVKYNGHLARPVICPIGVDLRRIGVLQRRRAVRDRRTMLKMRFERRFVIVGIDRCVQTSGIVQKLMAFEEFLISHPKHSENISLVQVVLPVNPKLVSRQNKNLRARIDQMVGRCNARFARIGSSQRPIYCLHQSLASNDLCALYEIANAIFVTPTTEGMNLVPFEYLVCRENRGVPGTVIISEFAGCASSLSGAIIVNPASTDGMAMAISKALSMDEDQRCQRHANMIRVVTRFTATNWLHTYTKLLEELVTRRSDGKHGGIELENLPIQMLVDAIAASNQLHSTIGPHIHVTEANDEVGSNIDGSINDNETCEGFSSCMSKQIPAKKHLLVVDFEDVLVAAQTVADILTLAPKVRGDIMKLCQSSSIQVLVLSTRPRQVIAKVLHGLPCWIAAEHGYVVRLGWPGDGQDDSWSDWKEVTPDPGLTSDRTWLEVCGEIFHHYGRRTPGAMVETTQVSISLHIEDADREYAASIARQLLSTLSETAAGLPIKTHLGKRSVDVIHVAVNKGAAVSLAMSRLKGIIANEEKQINPQLIEHTIDGALDNELNGERSVHRIGEDSSKSFEDNTLKEATPNVESPSMSKFVEEDNAIGSDLGEYAGIVSIICILTGHEASDESVFKMLKNCCNVASSIVSFQEKIVYNQGRTIDLNTPKSRSGTENLEETGNSVNTSMQPSVYVAKDLLTPQSNPPSLRLSEQSKITRSPGVNSRPYAVLCTMKMYATSLTSSAAFNCRSMEDVHALIESMANVMTSPNAPTSSGEASD